MKTFVHVTFTAILPVLLPDTSVRELGAQSRILDLPLQPQPQGRQQRRLGRAQRPGRLCWPNSRQCLLSCARHIFRTQCPGESSSQRTRHG